MPTHPPKSPEVFVSYSSKDKKYKDDLLKQLKVLAEQHVISTWHDGLLVPGQPWNQEILEHLNSSRVILLLISPDFLSSDYVNKVELKTAAARHKRRETCVIPVLVRNVNSWQGYPFGDLKLGDLQAVPPGAKFVVDWDNRAKAFAEVARGIQRVVENLQPTLDSHQNPRIPPPPIVEFVARKGRDGSYIVERLKEYLAQTNKRLITLSGEGGVGKTTIAAEVARSFEHAFGGRVVWASAEKRSDFTLSTLFDEIATQLGDTAPLTLAIEDKEKAVISLIAAGPTLLVLDNFETVSPSEQLLCADFLRGRAPGPSLITSRQQIPATPNIPVDGMSPEEAEEFLNKLILQMQEPSVFSEPIRNEIVRTSDARPYVMEWVVAQIDQRAEQPATILGELSQGEGDAAQRIFDHSFNLPQMGDDGQAALLALSLFIPNASRPALGLVAGFGEDTQRLDVAIRSLRTLLLVKGANENRRLAVEGLTRSLARARLEKDKRRKRLQTTFVEYFVDYANLYTNSTAEDFDALESEKDNVLFAIHLALGDDQLGAVMKIWSPMQEFLETHGYWVDAIRTGQLALGTGRKLGNELAVRQFAHNLGVMHHRRGELAEARQLYKESLEISTRLDNQVGISTTLHTLANLARIEGEFDEARLLYYQSLKISEKLGKQIVIASTLHELGILAQLQGKMDEARQFLEKSLEISKQLNNQSVIASTISQLGTIHLELNEISESKAKHEESLAIRRKIGDQHGIAVDLNQLGSLAKREGNKVEAARLFTEAMLTL